MRLFMMSMILYWVAVTSVAPSTAVKVFVKGESSYYCIKIPYLFRTQANTLLAFGEGRGKYGRNSCDDFSGTDLVMKRSEDNGQTWSALSLFYSNSSMTEVAVIGNAAPVQDKSSGRIFVPFCRNNEEVFISYSDDDGITWSQPISQPQLVHSSWKWVGLGPPGGIQLSSGRLLIPGYHTTLIKGDGELSRGHTIYSDDHGLTWSIGSSRFGFPYLSNECQAVELRNGSVLINARTFLNHRMQIISHDGGITFEQPYIANTLLQPLEGCEGSIVRDEKNGILYFSDPYDTSLVRMNMTIFSSYDEGLTWNTLTNVDRGSVAYSSLQVRPESVVELLYERSDTPSVVFEPDEIVYYSYTPKTIET
jgi:sialidase-1